MSTPLGLDPLLLEILACPCERHAPLREAAQSHSLVCTICATSFAVQDGVPVLLLDEAVPGPAGIGVRDAAVDAADAESDDAAGGPDGEA